MTRFAPPDAALATPLPAALPTETSPAIILCDGGGRWHKMSWLSKPCFLKMLFLRHVPRRIACIHRAIIELDSFLALTGNQLPNKTAITENTTVYFHHGSSMSCN
jgi:hypothetical protein